MFLRSAILLIALTVSWSFVSAQQIKNYDLVQMWKANKFDTTVFQQDVTVPDTTAAVLRIKGILWLKDVNFKTGTIDVDMRGKDVFLRSFPGIAFHAKNKKVYDLVYFCPFRFDDGDTTRWYSVKYMSEPDYTYVKLRKEHRHVYENEIVPSPKPSDWFHATIKVTKEWIEIYVNHASTPSLKLKLLPTLTSGKIGLWSPEYSLSSDFANLTIKQD